MLAHAFMRPPHSVGQGDVAEHFVEPAFLGVDLVELPAFACGKLRHAARERRAGGFIRIHAGFDAIVFCAEDVHALRARHLREALGERRRGEPAGAQVHGAGGFRARLELFRCAVRDDASAVDDDHARAHDFHLFEDVRRKNDGLVGAHALDEIAHFVLLIRIETVGGLVEDENVGIVYERLREAGAVLVPLGERVYRLVQHVFEEAQLDCAIHRPAARVAAQAAELGREMKEAVHGHVGITGRVLRQIADQALRGNRVLEHIVAADGDRAGGRGNEADHHAHGGRLAGAVRAEESQDFAAFHRERHIVDGDLGAERLGEVLNLDQCSSSCSGFMRRRGLFAR